MIHDYGFNFLKQVSEHLIIFNFGMVVVVVVVVVMAAAVVMMMMMMMMTTNMQMMMIMTMLHKRRYTVHKMNADIQFTK
jgi:hypothetical protein